DPDPICTEYIFNLTNLSEDPTKRVYLFMFNAYKNAAFSENNIEDNTDEAKNINIDKIKRIEFTFEKLDSSQLNYRSYIRAGFFDRGIEYNNNLLESLLGEDKKNSGGLDARDQAFRNNQYVLSPFQ
ncbi:4860_t:CDS:1, partial [Ambispora gerdemannii]